MTPAARIKAEPPHTGDLPVWGDPVRSVAPSYLGEGIAYGRSETVFTIHAPCIVRMLKGFLMLRSLRPRPVRPVMLLLFLLLACALLGSSRNAYADKVDDYIKTQMQKQHIPGLSLAVVKDGKVIKAQGYGLANVELGVPAKPETVYKIGSVSKQFIAAGIMLLIQDGKIRLEDKISTFLEGTPDTWQEITVRHLLTHTAGIVREAPGFDPLKIQNDADVIKTAYPLPLRFAPGEKWEYCNVGYFALAEIIRKVTGKPWGDYLSERLFTPLQMQATCTTSMTQLVPHRASGYDGTADKRQNASPWLALRPSGAFLSSVLDLAKWDAALYTDGFLKSSVREQMLSPVNLNDGTAHPYGFGWRLDTVGGHRRVHHGGAMPGFRAEMARFVDDKLTFIVLTNSGSADPDAIAQGVAALYIPGLIPERKETKIDLKVLDAYAGYYQGFPSDVVTVTRQGEMLLLQGGRVGKSANCLVLTVEGRELWRAKRVP